MLYRLLGKQYFAIPPVAWETGFERRLDDIVEEECTVNEKTKSSNLEPLE